MLKLLLPLYLAVIPVKQASGASFEATCNDRTVVVDIGPDASAARAQAFTDLSYYMLNGLSPDKTCSITGSLTVRCTSLYEGACRLLTAVNNSLTYDELRDFYQSNHLATITVRKHDDYVKKNLQEFIAATNYTTWPRTIVNRSGIKQKTRVIYRSPANFPQQISVSETRNCDNGDLNAEKLETEIAVRRHGGERTFEFYTYDRSGALAEHSEFPAGERPSPTVCVACHYHPGQRAVTRFIPQ